MADGKIIFNTKLDNSNLEKDLAAAKKKIDKAMDDIQKNENAKIPLTEQMEEYSKQLDEAKKNLRELKDEMAAAQEAMAPGASPEDYLAGAENLPKLQAAVKEQEAEVAKIQGSWEKVSNKVAEYDRKIADANETIEYQTEKARGLVKEMTSFGAKATESMERAKASAEKFGKKLLSIGASVLVFNAVRSGMRAVVDYTKKLLSTNSEYKAQLAQLKGALMTAFQPIYSYVLPGVIAVLKVLTAIVSVVARVISSLFGTTVQDSAKAAEALNKEADAIGGVGSAAEEAQKQLMGFDEINQLQEPETGSTGGGGAGVADISPDFSHFDTEEYKAKVDELTVYLSGALLALGAILAFSGANIPLGIGLMAAGAIGLATVVKENWGAMSGELQKQITIVMGILGGAMLVIGAILAFSGVSVAKGILLMAIGAASLAGTVAINWNTISSALQGPIGTVTAIVSAALLVLGIILCATGVALPLGIALIAAGAIGLVTVTALNWNAITEKVKSVWEDIKSWFNTNVMPKLTITYWTEKLSSIPEAIGGVFSSVWETIQEVWNEIAGFFDWFVGTWNNIFGGGKTGSVGVAKGAASAVAYDMPRTSIPVPALAQGRVLPPNKPFLALVGDQKNGTNVEAPLATIKQAVAEVMAQNGGGKFDVTVSFEGTEAQLIRYLAPKITVQQRRAERAKGG